MYELDERPDNPMNQDIAPGPQDFERGRRMIRETIDINGIEMNYACFGEGSQPMVIIPGLSLVPVLTFADFVVNVYSIFNDGFTTYLFERRENMPETYNIQDMARDTAEVMKALGLSATCLFGTSQGGMIAQCIAIEYPELVKKLALGSTVSCIPDIYAEPALGKWIRLAEAGRIHELNHSFSEDVYSGEVFERNKRGILAMEGMITTRDVERFIIQSHGSDGFDLSEDLSRIQCPALLMGAEKDKVFSVDRMRKTVEGIGCASYFYKDYSHVVYDEAPDFKERLLAFFRE